MLNLERKTRSQGFSQVYSKWFAMRIGNVPIFTYTSVFGKEKVASK